MNKIITFCCKLLLLQFFLFNYSFAQVFYNLQTIAGDGTTGFSGDGGLASNARFNGLSGIEVDAAGNIYVADLLNNRIRKIYATTGIIQTIAGTGVAGSSGDGGNASQAQIEPTAIALDAAGNIYLLDRNAHKVRKIDASTNIITTIAGTGISGFSGDGGSASLAQFASPNRLAVDAANNIYIADFSNYRIRKIDANTGIVSTIAGNGTAGYSGDGGDATQAQIHSITDLAVDALGNVYFTTGDNRARRVDSFTGKISLVAGTGVNGYAGDSGDATQAQLKTPFGISVDPYGDVYIADYANARLRKVTACTGIITTVAGTGVVSSGPDGTTPTNTNLLPQKVFTDVHSNIYIQENARIRKLTPHQSDLNLRANKLQAYAGSTIKVPIRVQTAIGTSGMVMDLDFPINKASFVNITDINTKLLGFNTVPYNEFTEVNPGKIRFSWVNPGSSNINLEAGEVLFNLVLNLPSTLAVGDHFSIDITNALGLLGISHTLYTNTQPGCVSIVDKVYAISGNIKTTNDTPVKEVLLTLNGTTDNSNFNVSTAEDGTYRFTNLSEGNYTLTPSKQANVGNGIDMNDFMAIQRHILGQATLDSPYKIIAADLNLSGTIDVADLLLARRIILGLATPLVKNWRFIPAGYVFVDPANPFNESFPESFSIDLNSDQANQDFIATKVGDVVTSANPQQRVTSQPVILNTPNQEVFEGEMIQIPVTTGANFNQIAFLQGTLNFDPKVLKYQGVSPASLPLKSEDHLNTRLANQGSVAFAYNDPKGNNIAIEDGKVLFYVNFKVIGKQNQSTAIGLTNQMTTSEALNGKTNTAQQLQLNSGEIKLVAPQVNIFPNPAKRFNVTFGITNNQSRVKLSLRNPQGQKVASQTKTYGKGLHQINWQPNIMPGTYFLTIETNQYKVTRKLVVQ